MINQTAIISLAPDININIVDIPNPVIITSDVTNNTKRLADLSVQIDQLIYLENTAIDMVYVANEIQLAPIAQFDPTFVYYVSTNLHKSSFYCHPGIFSMISSLYKINLERYQFTNIDINTPDLLNERIFWLLNRIGVEYKIEQD